MKITLLFVAVAMAGFTACDSKEEKVRKQDLENKADALENHGKAVKEKAERDADATEAAKKNLDRQAEALRKEGELNEQKLKADAERLREQK
jgi:hypothetical protein